MVNSVCHIVISCQGEFQKVKRGEGRVTGGRSSFARGFGGQGRSAGRRRRFLFFSFWGDPSSRKLRCDGAGRKRAGRIGFQGLLVHSLLFFPFSGGGGTHQLTYEDNAGGVSPDKLQNLVVPGHSETDPFSKTIGSYKTGGKKAVFRLAEAAQIMSRYWSPAETFEDQTLSVQLDQEWI